MIQFLLGFAAAWFLLAVFLFVSEEFCQRSVMHIDSQWLYYVLVAPALLPTVAAILPIAIIVRLRRRLLQKLIKDGGF